MVKLVEADALRATTIIGSKVRTHSHVHVGSIEDFVLDMETGKIAYAVLAAGGILGLGEKLFAVPFQSMLFDMEKKEFLIDVDLEKLKQAPGFDRNHWPKMGNRVWGSQIHSFYGKRPYWE
ncbi:MAG: PRC-barrel domain-containing protein [Acidobacteria bacterium]|nr:PRC-barrel domain-containing protein [Acidobacteriota bacterium]